MLQESKWDAQKLVAPRYGPAGPLLESSGRSCSTLSNRPRNQFRILVGLRSKTSLCRYPGRKGRELRKLSNHVKMYAPVPMHAPELLNTNRQVWTRVLNGL